MTPGCFLLSYIHVCMYTKHRIITIQYNHRPNYNNHTIANLILYISDLLYSFSQIVVNYSLFDFNAFYIHDV